MGSTTWSMMGGGWLYLLSAVWLLAIAGGQDVGVSMCCPAGRVLKIVKNNGRKLGGKERGDEYIPKCVRNRRAAKDTLEGSTITVYDGGDEDLVVVKKTGVQLPACTLGRKFQMVSLKGKDDTGNEGSGDVGEVERISRVRLGDWDCGKSKCHKGNVYVDDKPVCDDGWDDTDANVVCKELGFTSGGYATKESYFGKVDLERQSGFDEVRCSGRESSLVDCRHESHDDCGDGEGAGVVCYREPGDYEESGDYSYNSGSSGSSSSAVPLTITGDLVLGDNTTYKAGEFCLAGVIQGEDEWDKEVPEGEAVAVMCEPCKSEILCHLLLIDMFDQLGGGNAIKTDGSVGTPVHNNYIGYIADKNGDGMVDFKEFKAKMEDYVEKIFNELDKDDDGLLDKDVSMKTLSATFFSRVLDELFLLIDMNQDDILAMEDFPAPKSIFDRNKDGRISLTEFNGVSLIKLPAPVYRLYASLDKDKNEKLSLDEANNFIKGALAMIDRNQDCSINIDEVITSLDECKLPKQYQLAVKLLGDYYLEMGDFFLRELVAAADSDGDKKATLAEIIGLKDPAVLFDIPYVAARLGSPNYGTLAFLTGDQYGPGYGSRWEHQQAVVEMWLNVLYEFVDNRTFQSAPTDYCGL